MGQRGEYRYIGIFSCDITTRLVSNILHEVQGQDAVQSPLRWQSLSQPCHPPYGGCRSWVSRKAGTQDGGGVHLSAAKNQPLLWWRYTRLLFNLLFDTGDLQRRNNVG